MKPNAGAARQFERLSRADLDKSEAIIAVEILARVIKECDVSTVQGLHGVLNKTISDMSETTENNPSVKSACELFQRFITLPIADAPDDFNHCKQILQDRATIFLEKVDGCKQRIAENFANLLPDGARILVHSFSRVVLTALCHAEKSKSGSFGIHCYVTTGAPNFSGPKMTRALARSKIPCTLVPDLSIAYLMPQVDLVILGARAVVESGGILNDMGTSTVAMIATSFGKPVYVLAESYKFIRIYPLDQRHIPTEFKGKYPDEHRLLFTTMFDEATNRSFTFDGRLHHSQSDRVAASELWNSGLQGSKSFYFHFPLCGLEEPTNSRCEPYAKHHMHPSALNRTLTRALKRLSDGTSDLVVVYYDQLDTVGHTAGPLSNELLLNVLPQLDQVLLDLVQQLRASSRDVHLVLTSDHGMTEVRGKELLDRFVPRNHVKKVINRGSTVGIWPHPNHYDLAYRRLEGLRKRHFAVYNRSTIPSSWRTGGPLFPPVLLVAEPGYLIHSDQWPIETNHYDLTQPFVGAHGYTATELDMHVPLFVFGPKVRPGVTYAGGPLDQVHTYRFLAALSGQSDTLQPIATSTAYGASIWSSLGIVLRSAIIVTSLGLLCFFCALMLVVLLWKVRRSRMPSYLIKDMDRNDDDMDERLISPDAVVKTTAGRDSVTA
ncbi:Translation initiation factor eIF-2B subunit alpha [Fasciola gigantica]|uniref:Translation initiation factor eIF2B subunit alpha n=1 Tax=Fasciola gigantica TaxID=46835 RepID=A0A504YJL7_FASGI|nr:Translation initiation factor eIF-2B subunit alpha [Fasciola gigantica]